MEGFGGPPAGGPPTHFVALIFRHNDEYLFESTELGAMPWIRSSGVDYDLSPSIGVDRWISWFRDAAERIGVDRGARMHINVLLRMTFRPLANMQIHPAIVTVTKPEFERVASLLTKAMRLTGSQIAHDAENNLFFGPILDATAEAPIAAKA